MVANDYRNPVLNADWPDPDVVVVDDVYYLVTSSFHRVPGLPILRSHDLVNWQPVGHAIASVPGHVEPPRPGHGVWAPAMRSFPDGIRLYWGDPDTGLWMTRADRADGPWELPHLVVGGRGLIDPCPLVDEDGRAWLVHGWAHSRSGIANRLDVFPLSEDGRSVTGASRVLIDGDDIAGCSVLEGPKFYRARGYYWVFAPAGGVTTGWQYVFRAATLDGPWEHRIVLAQGASDVNGPHQGAWVTTPAGEDWFVHFQDRGWAGRVIHLQPMSWSVDQWPVMGNAGEPVAAYRAPANVAGSGAAHAGSTRHAPTPWPTESSWFLTGTTTSGADFPLPVPSAHTIRVAAQAGEADDPRARPVLARTIDGAGSTSRLRLRIDSGVEQATLALIGTTALSITLEPDQVVTRVWDDDGATESARLAVTGDVVELHLRVGHDGAIVVRMTTDAGQAEVRWTATAGVWVGTTLGLFARSAARAGDAAAPGFHLEVLPAPSR